MTIERERPLPAGRYWVDVFESKRIQWEEWRDLFVREGKVFVEHTEDFPSNEGGEARQFVIFRTTVPLVWPDDTMLIGVNVATPDIQSSDDTVSKPVIETPLSSLSSLTDVAKTAIAVVTGVVVVVGVVIIGSKFGQRFRRKR